MPEQAARAAEVIDREPDLRLMTDVVAEIAYVLSSMYGIPRDAVDALVTLIRRRSW